MEADKSLNQGPQTHREISGRQKLKFVILVCIEDEINTLCPSTSNQWTRIKVHLAPKILFSLK